MIKTFIKRPVLSTVISVIIVLLGILGLIKLPIEQYPSIAPPTVQVSASYTGANAEVVLKNVIVPLEEAINGVENMMYMTSSAGNDGSASIQVYFQVGTDPDKDAVNVQNLVSSATSQLPQEVVKVGVTVRKQQASMVLISVLYSDKPDYDQTFLQNYANINVLPQLKRIPGVGSANSFGSRDYAMRIWLKPDVMSVYGLTPGDVSAALAEQNVDAAPGKFGENGDQSFQYVITYTGKLQTVSQFENIIVKAKTTGQLLRLKDIARVELGALSYNNIGAINGRPAVGMAISQTAGSNARDVINMSKQVLEEASKNFPDGIHYVNVVDINKFLSASIEKVIRTLLECFGLVFLVIFLFLQDIRSTIIHGISVPVSITGTFFFLYIFGYSINLLTLFALVLAIGIVVDDAIVVVEAVHAKLEHGYTSPRKAAIDAMSEITGAILSITLIMAAVFIPVTFIGGSTGVFYKQFGVTLAVAISISAVNALTLCPALAAMFLRPPKHKQEGYVHKNFLQKFGMGFNAAYDSLTSKYTRAIKFLSVRKWIILASAAIFIGGFVYLMETTPSSFVPDEDLGTVFVPITLPPASSMERTLAVVKQVADSASSIPEVANVFRIAGLNFFAGSGSSYGMVILELKDWDQRKGVSNLDVIKMLNKKVSGLREATVFAISLPTITGFGGTGGFSFQLQDKGGHSIQEFYGVAQKFLAELRKRPEIQYATTAFNPGFPQYELSANVAKIKEAGMSVSDILSTMQFYYGGFYASNFNEFGKQYRVMVQADTNYRANLEGLNKIYVKSGNGQMAPITEFINMKRVYGPESISRFNLFTSISVNGSPNAGFSSGEALLAIKDVAAKTLPPGYGYEYSGISREEQSSGSQSIYIFLLSLVFVYLLLSAQYESYLLPFAVLLSMPVGLSGVYIFAKMFGIGNNIYMQISLIMLIGLLAKNAILIVEFAVERRRKGMGLVESAIEGAKARLRPILMTSFAFVFGLMPLMFATGAGAYGNRSIGTGAIGGMLVGTVLGVFVIPGLFIIFQAIQEKIRANKYDENDELIITH
ncbi:MAG TPA: efflux RND transporter permease subunit [Chitinophagaceae bacterium]|nr:efflux RND transporter permease subunit [Chitinophagaceae bacterium]